MYRQIGICCSLVAIVIGSCLSFGQSPCYQLGDMTCTQCMQNAYPGIPNDCRGSACICAEDRVCPCPAYKTDQYLGTVKTPMNCQYGANPCKDDFTIKLDGQGQPEEKSCGTIRACNDGCTKFVIGPGPDDFQWRCSNDLGSNEVLVTCSVYELIGDDCPEG